MCYDCFAKIYKECINEDLCINVNEKGKGKYTKYKYCWECSIKAREDYLNITKECD